MNGNKIHTKERMVEFYVSQFIQQDQPLENCYNVDLQYVDCVGQEPSNTCSMKRDMESCRKNTTESRRSSQYWTS
jgi:hypothetical protein